MVNAPRRLIRCTGDGASAAVPPATPPIVGFRFISGLCNASALFPAPDNHRRIPSVLPPNPFPFLCLNAKRLLLLLLLLLGQYLTLLDGRSRGRGICFSGRWNAIHSLA